MARNYRRGFGKGRKGGRSRKQATYFVSRGGIRL